mgnify:CR=1 FL=1
MLELDKILELHKQVLPNIKWTYNKKYIRRSIPRSNWYFLKLHVPKYIEIFVGAFSYYKEGKALWLNTIAIDKLYQGKGYGSEILKFVENKAREVGCKKIKTWSDKADFFKKSGYLQGEKYRMWWLFEKEIK